MFGKGSTLVHVQSSSQEQLLLDPMFEVPDSTISGVHVDEAAVLGESPVQYSEDTGSPDDTKDSASSTNELSATRTGHSEDSVAA